MNKYWFKPKKYGYGFVPTSWEGWVATLMLVVVMLGALWVSGLFSEQINWILMVVLISLIVIVTTALFKPKTKGKVKWRWGE